MIKFKRRRGSSLRKSKMLLIIETTRLRIGRKKIFRFRPKT